MRMHKCFIMVLTVKQSNIATLRGQASKDRRTMVSNLDSGVSGRDALVLTMSKGMHPGLLYSLQPCLNT